MESFAFAYGITTQPRAFHGFLRETIEVYSETPIYQCRMTALISVPNTRTAYHSRTVKTAESLLSQGFRLFHFQSENGTDNVI